MTAAANRFFARGWVKPIAWLMLVIGLLLAAASITDRLRSESGPIVRPPSFTTYPHSTTVPGHPSFAGACGVDLAIVVPSVISAGEQFTAELQASGIDPSSECNNARVTVVAEGSPGAEVIPSGEVVAILGSQPQLMSWRVLFEEAREATLIATVTSLTGAQDVIATDLEVQPNSHRPDAAEL